MEKDENVNSYTWLALESVALGALMPLFISLLLNGMYLAAATAIYIALVLLLGVTTKKILAFKEGVHITFFKLVLDLKIVLLGVTVSAFAGGNPIIGVIALVGFIVFLMLWLLTIAVKVLN